MVSSFRTQVMVVTAGLVIVTSVALGAVLISVSARMMYQQIEGTGRGLARVLAAQMDQKRELIDKLLQPPVDMPPRGGGAMPPMPGPGGLLRQGPRPQGPPPRGAMAPMIHDAGPKAGAPDVGFESDLLELAEIVRARRIAVVAEGRILGSVVPKGASFDDVSDTEIVALHEQLKTLPAGKSVVLEGPSSIAIMTLLSTPGPSGEKAGLLLQMPKTLPRHFIVARAALLALTALAVVGAALGVAWSLSRSISKPLSNLADTARTYGEGCLDEPAPVAGPTETRRLGFVLNSMAASLKEHIQSLKEETSRREQLESELRVAAKLQQSLLPKPGLQRFGCVEVLGWSEAAAAVGGDFYDFRMVSDDTLAFVIGDATGKGIPAALLAGKCLSVLQALTEAHPEPGDLLRRANTVIWEQFRGDGHFVTAFLGIIDLPTRRLHYSRAGHNPPFFARAGDGVPTPLADQQGLPLAAVPGSLFGSTLVEVSPGDTFLMYTDGITEMTDADGQLYGEDRLGEVFARHSGEPLPDVLAAVTDGVRSYGGHWPPQDDCTALLLRIC